MKLGFEDGCIYRYTIEYGICNAYLYTNHENPKHRFNVLSSMCFGIRKNVLCCYIVRIEKVTLDDVLKRYSNYNKEEYIKSANEILSFNGDNYIWDKDGNRYYFTSCVLPLDDKDWSDDYCDEYKYFEG